MELVWNTSTSLQHKATSPAPAAAAQCRRSPAESPLIAQLAGLDPGCALPVPRCGSFSDTGAPRHRGAAPTNPRGALIVSDSGHCWFRVFLGFFILFSTIAASRCSSSTTHGQWGTLGAALFLYFMLFSVQFYSHLPSTPTLPFWGTRPCPFHDVAPQ